MLTLSFSGIGSAFYPQYGNTSAYFFCGGTLYLLDCGATVFSAMEKKQIFDRADKIVVLITHLHADHVGSLGTLISYCKYVRAVPITIVHPENNMNEYLRLNGITKEQYTFFGDNAFADENIHVKFISVPHTKSLNAYGMIIKDQNDSVYYSGDAGDLPEEVWQAFVNRKIKLIYQDCSLTGVRGKNHGDYHYFKALCPPELRPCFFVIHLNKPCRDQAQADGFGVPAF